MTQDPALVNLLEQYRDMRTPPEVEAQDTSVSALLECLRAKARSIPLETIQIGQRYVEKLEDEEPTDFKTAAARTIDSYSQTLQTQYQILQNLIRLGETVEKQRDSDPGAQRHREVWWFVARTVLAQAGQDL